MTDALVVGGGPAGSSVGLQLARKGYDVVILERQHFPRPKVCGEYLSIAAVNAIRHLNASQDILAGGHPITSVALAAFGSEQLRLTLPGSGALALPRATLDDRLLQCALHHGAQLRTGAYLHHEADNGTMSVNYRDEHGGVRSLQTRTLIGADGAWSSVAGRNRMAGSQRRAGRWAVGGHLLNQPRSHELEMFVGSGGYYARNPLSDTVVNAMLVMPRPALADEADHLVASISGGRHQFNESELERRVAIGPLRYAPERISTDRIVLTGDASGLLDPFTGQGVACAVSLAFAACRAVESILAGQPAERVGRRYKREWRAIVGPRKLLSFFIDLLIRTPQLRWRALRGAQRDRSVAEAILAAVSGAAPARDAFSPRLLWRLFA